MLAFPFLRVVVFLSVGNSMYHYMYVRVVFSGTVITFWLRAWLVYTWYIGSLAQDIDRLSESIVHSALPFVHLYLGNLTLIASNALIKVSKGTICSTHVMKLALAFPPCGLIFFQSNKCEFYVSFDVVHKETIMLYSEKYSILNYLQTKVCESGFCWGTLAALCGQKGPTDFGL